MAISRKLFAAAVLCVGLAAPMAAQRDRQMGGLGLEAFEDKNFNGRSATFLDDTPDLRTTGMSSRISSLRIANGQTWQVCTGINYTGRCQVFSGNESDLAKRTGWNDAIMSLRRVGGNRGGGGPVGPGFGGGPGFGPGPGRGVELYAGTRYSGQRKAVTSSVSNLRSIDFNDRASSLRIARGEVWEICVNANYDDCRVVDDDVPDLGVIGLNREISSMRPRFNGRGGGGPAIGRPRIVFYSEIGYRGRSTTLERDTPNLRLPGGVRSARVLSGQWEVCENDRYNGRCITITGDVPDLRSSILRTDPSSARIR
jgi:hypothetical protein